MSNGRANRGCLGLLFGWLAPSPETSALRVTFPYGKRDLLSAAELTFFRVLKSQLPEDWHLVTKVNLADLFFVRQRHRNQPRAIGCLRGSCV
jgi:hypothetical protein